MAFGILNTDPSKGKPPGTEFLEDVDDNTHGAEAVLVPQPSASPDDPLRMPRIRKEAYFLALIYGACVTGVVGPVLVPGFSIVAQAFDIGLTQVTLLNGSLVMALGVSAYLCAPISSLYGRRLVYLFTTLVMCFGCVWAGYAKSYRSLLGSRIFQGLGMGAFFSLAGTASINDVFFVHERGRRAGLWNFAVIVCVNVAPVISGYVITGLSWEWAFRILAVAFGVAFVLAYFFIPETLFERDSSIAGIEPPATPPENLSEDLDESNKKQPPHSSETGKEKLGRNVSKWNPLKQTACQPHGGQLQLLRRLPILLIAPFGLLRHPCVLWGCAMWSVTFSWTIIQGAVADQIWSAPPFNLSATSVGILIGIPPLIGSALGTVFGGWFCDWTAKVMAVRNDGIYEPEFRLVIMIPTLIATGIGSFGLGLAIDSGLTVYASAVFLGFLNFGVGVGCTGIVAYMNDVCRDQAAEGFGLAMLVKSAFAFGLTFMLNDYYINHGAAVFFSTFAGLTTGATLLTIPLYVFGKRIRACVHI